MTWVTGIEELYQKFLHTMLNWNSWNILNFFFLNMSNGSFFIMEWDINKAFQSNALNRSLSFFLSFL